VCFNASTGDGYSECDHAVRDISHPNIPVPDIAEPSTMDRKKGRSKVKK